MSVHDYFLADCPTYKDYLNVFLTKDDMRLLRNMRIAQHLVKLNYRSTTSIYTREVFKLRKRKVLDTLFPVIRNVTPYSRGLDPKDPVIKEIALREKPNQQKLLSTILFITLKTEGTDQSSYMDLADSLRLSYDNNNGLFWRAVFEERKRLKPNEKHLSFFDFRKGVVCHNDSPNYHVVHDADHGLTFMHKGDHKEIFVIEPFASHCTQTTVVSPIYGYVKFFDHTVRKKI